MQLFAAVPEPVALLNQWGANVFATLESFTDEVTVKSCPLRRAEHSSVELNRFGNSIRAGFTPVLHVQRRVRLSEGYLNDHPDEPDTLLNQSALCPKGFDNGHYYT